MIFFASSFLFSLLYFSAYGKGGAAPTIPPFMPTRTLVFLMTAARASFIASKLLSGGYPPDLPAAIIENATLPHQRTFYSRLATLGDDAKNNKVTHPATIIVGKVVAVLHQEQYKESEDVRGEEGEITLLPVNHPQYIPGIPISHTVPTAAKLGLQPTSAVFPPAVKAIDFTDEHLAFINKRLSGRTPQQILAWCADTLPGFVQVTSFGATGMVIIDMMVRFISVFFHLAGILTLPSLSPPPHKRINLAFPCQLSSWILCTTLKRL